MNKTQNHSLQKKQFGASAYWGVFAVIAVAAVCMVPVFATGAGGAANSVGIFKRIGTMITSVYNDIFAITTACAVLTATIALVIRMVSSNQRSVDTASMWLKRIVISWIAINSMTYIITFLEGNLGGGKWGGFSG